MRRLFARSLTFFALALVLLAVSLSGVGIVGVHRSIAAWTRHRTEQLRTVAADLLAGQLEPAAVSVNSSLFVFTPDRTLVFSNRGRGRNLPEESLVPIEEDGQLIGYYATGSIGFAEDAANRSLLQALSATLWIGIPLALVLAMGVAVAFARRLSAPAHAVAEGLERIGAGELGVPVPERGTDEIVHIARAANRLRKQLADEREIRKQWSQDIAHDLRTPIAALQGQFEAMADGVMSATPERIRRVHAEISRLGELVSSLDELSRLESPELRPEIRTVPAGEFVSDVRQLFGQKAAARDITLDTSCRVESLRGDPLLLHRAVANLLSNALRHVPDGGLVRLGIRPEEEGVVIEVFNSGQPIAPADAARAFERLYRGEYARSSPGAGLGLTIVKRIVELHGGSVSIGPAAEGGTAARIRLPQ